jgi:hypothetical protein
MAGAFTAYDIERLTALLLADAASEVVGMVYEVGAEAIRRGSLHHTLVIESDVRYRAQVQEFDGEPLLLLWETPVEGRRRRRRRTSCASRPPMAGWRGCAGTTSAQKRSPRRRRGRAFRPGRTDTGSEHSGAALSQEVWDAVPRPADAGRRTRQASPVPASPAPTRW